MRTASVKTSDKPHQGQSHEGCLSLSGLRTKSFAWLIAATLVGTGVFVLLSNFRGSAEADPRAVGPDVGFAMTRGPFEVAVAASGLIQPFEVVDVGAQVSGLLSALHAVAWDLLVVA